MSLKPLYLVLLVTIIVVLVNSIPSVFAHAHASANSNKQPRVIHYYYDGRLLFVDNIVRRSIVWCNGTSLHGKRIFPHYGVYTYVSDDGTEFFEYLFPYPEPIPPEIQPAPNTGRGQVGTTAYTGRRKIVIVECINFPIP